MRAVILDCLREVEGGMPLSASIAKYPQVFPPTYKALVRAGEASGKIGLVLMIANFLGFLTEDCFQLHKS